MAAKKSEHRKMDITEYQYNLNSMIDQGDLGGTALAHAQLGFAHLRNRDIEEGKQQLELAEQAASNLEDLDQHAKVLGVVILGYKFSGHFMEAYVAAEAVMKLGLEHDNGGLQVDALSTQGQIQLESGDTTQAMELFNQAKEIADKIDDQRRQMNIIAAIGNCHLASSEPDQAFENFSSALVLAQEIKDLQAENAFNGNLGALLSFQGKHREAIAHFEKMLANHDQSEGEEIAIQTLRHLVKSYSHLGDIPKVMESAQRGLELTRQTEHVMALEFYESIIYSLYQQEKPDEARQATKDAIDLARANKEDDAELNLLLSLGESFHLSEMNSEALEVYEKSLNAAKRQARQEDVAYLTGRVGICLAETGQLDQAIKFHLEAVLMAKEQEIPNLEGEQLSMLALAYYDKGEFDQARQYCTSSQQVYQAAGLEDEVKKAESLLAQIESAIKSD